MTKKLAIFAALIAAPLFLAGCNGEQQPQQNTDGTVTGTIQPDTNTDAAEPAPETPPAN